MNIIECRNICKNFGEKVALDHVSVEIPQDYGAALVIFESLYKALMLNAFLDVALDERVVAAHFESQGSHPAHEIFSAEDSDRKNNHEKPCQT